MVVRLKARIRLAARPFSAMMAATVPGKITTPVAASLVWTMRWPEIPSEKSNIDLTSPASCRRRKPSVTLRGPATGNTRPAECPAGAHPVDREFGVLLLNKPEEVLYRYSLAKNAETFFQEIILPSGSHSRASNALTAPPPASTPATPTTLPSTPSSRKWPRPTTSRRTGPTPAPQPSSRTTHLG